MQWFITLNNLLTFDYEDEALRSRLIYLPLERAHVTEDSPLYKEGDASVRLEDPSFKESLRRPGVLQQWLVWAVKGQMLNAQEGKLPPLPPYLAEAKRKLYLKNDPLESFLEEHCEKGKELMVQTKDFKASLDSYLWEEHRTAKGFSLQLLTEKMDRKGYNKDSKVRLRQDPSGYQKVDYQGIRVLKDSPYCSGCFIE